MSGQGSTLRGLPRQECRFHSGNGVGNLAPKGFKSFKDLSIVEIVSSKKHSNRTICAVGELNFRPCGEIRNDGALASDNSSPQSGTQAAIGPDDFTIRIIGGLNGGNNGFVLIGIIKAAYDIKQLALGFSGVLKDGGKLVATDIGGGIKLWEGFETFKELLDPRVAGFETITGLQERGLVLPDRKIKISILCAAPIGKEFPDGMVKGAPQIMDCIAYYESEGLGDGFSIMELDSWLTSSAIVLNEQSAWFCQYKGFELPFKIGNVMYGSI